MTEPTDDVIAETYEAEYPVARGWLNRQRLMPGLRAVDRAAETRGYRRALDEIEAFLVSECKEAVDDGTLVFPETVRLLVAKQIQHMRGDQ